MTGRRIVVETIARAIYDSQLPTSSFDKRGRTIPFEDSGSVKEFRRAAVNVLEALSVPSPEALEAAAWAVFPASIPPSVGQVEMVRRGIAAFLRVQYGIEG